MNNKTGKSIDASKNTKRTEHKSLTRELNQSINVTEKELELDEAIVQRHFDGTMEEVTREAYEEALKHVPANPSREDMIAEAVWRMNALHFPKDIVDDFQKTGVIETVIDDFMIYPLTDKDLNHIRFLEKSNCLVYAAIYSHAVMGTLISYLVVTDQSEDWIYDRNMLKYNEMKAYVCSYEDPSIADFGTIIVRSHPEGMLLRIY